MSFDPFANQGGPAAWDPKASEESNRAADELFANERSEIHDDELIPNDGNPQQPGNLPDPDLESDEASE
ncbi:hypothetical protein [Salinibacterium sp. GXW1014]|uniref:hypothetical protein n=1 Tax=Salinibacterium sp. GXW1014 TaxID=3377838 RepID=UPI00383B6C44